jgi:hypothetical protein
MWKAPRERDHRRGGRIDAVTAPCPAAFWDSGRDALNRVSRRRVFTHDEALQHGKFPDAREPSPAIVQLSSAEGTTCHVAPTRASDGT